jgi:hypothetical protein
MDTSARKGIVLYLIGAVVFLMIWFAFLQELLISAEGRHPPLYYLIEWAKAHHLWS